MKTKLIVGLWNPWDKYESTRHNIWFKIIDLIANYSEWTPFMFDKKFNGDISIAKHEKYMLIFVKPQTFMNLSWDCVSKVLNYYKIEAENMLVIHDEIDLDPGVVKLKWNGGDNGHNGLKDITRKCGTNKYWKLKMGVGRPQEKSQVVNFVLWKLEKGTWENFLKQEEMIYEYVRQFLVNN